MADHRPARAWRGVRGAHGRRIEANGFQVIPSMMKSPLLIALAAGAVSVLIAFVPVLRHMLAPAAPISPPGPAASVEGAPWQIDRSQPDRIRVFGLSLPGSTLADARTRWGEDLKLALMGPRDGPVVLEGYLERHEAGGVGGRLLLSFDRGAQAELLDRWRDQLPGTPLEGGGRQHRLSAAAAAELAGAALVGLSFIPVAQLDAEVLGARFGTPSERIAGGGRLEHWLYPEQGLAVVLDAQGKDVLQYVAPGDFEARLAAPVRASPAPR